jgi:hypothetical protein
MSDVEGEVKNLGWEEAGRQSAVGSGLAARVLWDFAHSTHCRVPLLGLGLNPVHDRTHLRRLFLDIANVHQQIHEGATIFLDNSV